MKDNKNPHLHICYLRQMAIKVPSFSSCSSSLHANLALTVLVYAFNCNALLISLVTDLEYAEDLVLKFIISTTKFSYYLWTHEGF